jgi:HK97 family phage major capsid protein
MICTIEKKNMEILEKRRILDEQILGISSRKQERNELERNRYKKTFWNVMRGIEPKNALKEGLDGSGGVLVPDQFESKLVEGLKTENVI